MTGHPRRRNSARRRHQAAGNGNSSATSATVGSGSGDGNTTYTETLDGLAMDKSRQPSFDVQATDANAEGGAAPRRRQHHRQRHSKSFSWKQVGFSECSKTCGGGQCRVSLAKWIEFAGRLLSSLWFGSANKTGSGRHSIFSGIQ